VSVATVSTVINGRYRVASGISETVHVRLPTSLVLRSTTAAPR